jgi:hypothetical protein
VASGVAGTSSFAVGVRVLEDLLTNLSSTVEVSGFLGLLLGFAPAVVGLFCVVVVRLRVVAGDSTRTRFSSFGGTAPPSPACSSTGTAAHAPTVALPSMDLFTANVCCSFGDSTREGG